MCIRWAPCSTGVNVGSGITSACLDVPTTKPLPTTEISLAINDCDGTAPSGRTEYEASDTNCYPIPPLQRECLLHGETSCQAVVIQV